MSFFSQRLQLNRRREECTATLQIGQWRCEREEFKLNHRVGKSVEFENVIRSFTWGDSDPGRVGPNFYTKPLLSGRVPAATDRAPRRTGVSGVPGKIRRGWRDIRHGRESHFRSCGEQKRIISNPSAGISIPLPEEDIRSDFERFPRETAKSAGVPGRRLLSGSGTAAKFHALYGRSSLP